MLGNGECNPIERKFDQVTGFSNMLDRDDNEDTGSVRGNSSQENEIRNTPVNRDNIDFSRNMETLTGEMNLRISQEMNSLINGVNSHFESAISTAISERILPRMQNVVETVLARLLGSVPGMSRRPHTSKIDVHSLNEDNLINRNFHSHQNVSEPEEESLVIFQVQYKLMF